MSHTTRATCAFSYRHELPLGKPRMAYKYICKHCGELGIRRPRNKYKNVAEPICPTARKEKGRAQGCSSAAWSDFLKSSSLKGMRFIASTTLHSGIHRITESVFPSSERFLYRKRKCSKGNQRWAFEEDAQKWTLKRKEHPAWGKFRYPKATLLAFKDKGTEQEDENPVDFLRNTYGKCHTDDRQNQKQNG